MSDPIEGLIFDCDGTLINSMPVHWLAWQEVTQRHGIDFPEDRFYSLGGVPSWQVIQMLSEEQGVTLDAHAVAREKEEAFFPHMHRVEPVAAVIDIVKAHHGKLPMAVATGGVKPIIPDLLRQLNLLDYFESVVTSEDVTHQKPAPDIFLEAARRIGVDPQRCRAYEDTDLGMQAIRAAGMEAVDIRLMD